MPGVTPVGVRVSTARPLAINPLSRADLELYLTGSSLTGAPGSQISTWNDISGKARHAAQAAAAARPIVSLTSSPSGMKLAEGDGVNDSMQGPMPAFPPGVPNTNGYTVYIVTNLLSIVTGGAFPGVQLGASLSGMECKLHNDAGDAYPTVCTYGMGDLAFGAPARNSTTQATATGWQDLVYRWNVTPGSTPPTGTSQTLFKNGVQLNQFASTWALPWNGTYDIIGEFASGNQSCRALFACILGFSSAHSARTIRGIRAFLRNAVGI